MSTYYALNTGTTINPLLGNQYAGTMTHTMLVLRKVAGGYGKQGQSKPIVLSGSGTGYTEQVGSQIPLVADQSGRSMGRYQIIGIVAGHTVEGEVPSKKFKHYVMK